MRNQQIFEPQKSIIDHKRGLERDYSMTIFSQTSTKTFTIRNLKLTSNIVFVNEKFLYLVGCYISLERCSQRLFKDNTFKSVDLNYYHIFFKRILCSHTFFPNYWLIIHFLQAKWKGLFLPLQWISTKIIFIEIILKNYQWHNGIRSFK